MGVLRRRFADTRSQPALALAAKAPLNWAGAEGCPGVFGWWVGGGVVGFGWWCWLCSGLWAFSLESCLCCPVKHRGARVAMRWCLVLHRTTVEVRVGRVGVFWVGVWWL